MAVQNVGRLVGTGLVVAVAAVAAPFVIKLLKQVNLLKKYARLFVLSLARSQQLSAEFQRVMKAGLASKHANSTLMMLPSFVTQMPNGCETGDVYAVDLGGTNFRVLYVRLGRKKGIVLEEAVEQWEIPVDCYTGHVTGLMDFIAHHLELHVKTHGRKDEKVTVGFCFSFPTDQTALNSGRLIQWSKGFTCEGALGEDPVAQLQAALTARGLKADVAALVNDTVGVLAANRYVDPDTEVGVILGTGSNACYVDRVGSIPKWRPPGIPPHTDTIINIEWGGFESDALPRCQHDLDLDALTTNPGQMVFEKMFSGKYMGHVAGRILEELHQRAGLFEAAAREHTLRFDSFETPDMSRIDGDDSFSLDETRTVLASALGVADAETIGYTELAIAKRVCALVRARAAGLIAAALHAVLVHIGRASASAPQRTVVAIDGGLYEKYPKLQAATRSALDALLSAGIGASAARRLRDSIELRLAHGGSCLGAAVLAAAAE